MICAERNRRRRAGSDTRISQVIMTIVSLSQKDVKLGANLKSKKQREEQRGVAKSGDLSVRKWIDDLKYTTSCVTTQSMDVPHESRIDTCGNYDA